MATSIVDTLFGVSPERLQQQRAEAADARALQFAKLDPFQQATFAIGRGASGLAGAIGGALGGQDPELQRVTMRQQIAGQIDYTSEDSIRQGMAMLSDDPAAVQQLAQILRQQQESGALVGQRQAAAAKAAEPKAPPTTNDLTNARAIAALAGPEGSLEYNAAFDEEYRRLTGAKPPAPSIKTVGVAKGTNQPVYLDANTDQQFTFGTGPDGQQVRKLYVGGVDRTTAKTTVDARNIAEDSYAKEVGIDVAKSVINIINNAEAVVGTLPKMYETRKLLDTGALNTGFAAELQQVVDRAKTKILADKEAGERVTDTEYLNSLLGSDVFPQISQLGIGARGLDTPAEREFLREVITGTISMDLKTLKRMTDFRIRAAERAVENYNTKLEAGDLNKYQRISGRTLKPIAATPRPVSRQGDGTPGNPIKLE